MKKYLYIICCCCGLLWLAVACSQEEGATYSGTGKDEVTFPYSSVTLKYTASDETATVNVVRANGGSAKDYEIRATYNNAVFELPSSVSFAAGVAQTSLSFSMANMEIGETYTIGLKLIVDSADVSPFGTDSLTLKIVKNFVWEASGVAEYTSEAEENTADVKIEHAISSSPARYRLVSPYYVLNPEGATSGYHLEFTINENGNALSFPAKQPIGETYDAYGNIYIFHTNPAAGDSFTNEGNIFTIHAYFYVDAGMLGQMTEVFVWKEGWPGAN